MHARGFICLLASLASLANAQTPTKEERQKAQRAVYENYRSKHPGVQVTGGAVPNPKVISQSAPKFPQGFLAEPKRPALVIVYAVISESGEVKDPIVVTTSDPRLNSYVLDAVKSWRYEPVQTNGKSISVFQTLLVQTFLPSA